MLFVHCAKYDRTFPRSHAAAAAAAANRPQPAVPPLHPSHPLRSDPSIALHLILPPRDPIVCRTRGIGRELIEDVHHAPPADDAAASSHTNQSYRRRQCQQADQSKYRACPVLVLGLSPSNFAESAFRRVRASVGCLPPATTSDLDVNVDDVSPDDVPGGRQSRYDDDDDDDDDDDKVGGGEGRGDGVVDGDGDEDGDEDKDGDGDGARGSP